MLSSVQHMSKQRALAAAVARHTSLKGGLARSSTGTLTPALLQSVSKHQPDRFQRSLEVINLTNTGLQSPSTGSPPTCCFPTKRACAQKNEYPYPWRKEKKNNKVSGLKTICAREMMSAQQGKKTHTYKNTYFFEAHTKTRRSGNIRVRKEARNHDQINAQPSAREMNDVRTIGLKKKHTHTQTHTKNILLRRPGNVRVGTEVRNHDQLL